MSTAGSPKRKTVPWWMAAIVIVVALFGGLFVLARLGGDPASAESAKLNEKLLDAVDKSRRENYWEGMEKFGVTTKECPSCKTEIPLRAMRCPNCTSELTL